VTVLRLKWTVVTCGFVREMPPVSGLRFVAFDVLYPSAPLCVRLLVFFTHSVSRAVQKAATRTPG
jgi:hypothetical protein